MMGIDKLTHSPSWLLSPALITLTLPQDMLAGLILHILRHRRRKAGLAKKSEITGKTYAIAGEGIAVVSIAPARKTRRVYTMMLSWLIVTAIE